MSSPSIPGIHNFPEPNDGHATGIISNPTTQCPLTDSHLYNPYTKKYQPLTTPKPPQPKTKQKFLRSTSNDQYFWIGDDMTFTPDKNSTRLVLHNTNVGFYHQDDNFLQHKFINYLTRHTHF